MGKKNGLVRRAGEEKRMDSNNIHLRWTFCGKRRMGGWRCDSPTFVVKIMYLSFDVSLKAVKTVLENYSIVEEIFWSCRRFGSVELRDE